MISQRYLTGITPSGTPHLGNYVGSIRPSVQASLRPEVESFYFLADYHALIKIGEPERIQRSTLEIAASWLAAGLDPERVTFYRQSDVPEIAELTWLLTCVTSKGLLNRAHAYKAAVDQNVAAQEDPDANVNAGLFMSRFDAAAGVLHIILISVQPGIAIGEFAHVEFNGFPIGGAGFDLKVNRIDGGSGITSAILTGISVTSNFAGL